MDNWWDILMEELKGTDIDKEAIHEASSIIGDWLEEDFPNVGWDNGVAYPRHPEKPTIDCPYREPSKRQYPRESNSKINVIPSSHEGQCHSLLMVRSIGRIQFSQRLKEVVDSCIRCGGIRKCVIFYSNFWDDALFSKDRYSTFRSFKDRYGIHFIRLDIMQSAGKVSAIELL